MYSEAQHGRVVVLVLLREDAARLGLQHHVWPWDAGKLPTSAAWVLRGLIHLLASVAPERQQITATSKWQIPVL